MMPRSPRLEFQWTPEKQEIKHATLWAWLNCCDSVHTPDTEFLRKLPTQHACCGEILYPNSEHFSFREVNKIKRGVKANMPSCPTCAVMIDFAMSLADEI